MLGDRVFDRGRAALGIEVQGDTPDIDVNLPEDVPNWTAEGLAAGPPLDDPPPPPAADPPLREENRPVQSRAAWERDVGKAGAPGRDQLHTTDATRLRDVARRYVAAAEFLRTRPDPRTGVRTRRASACRGWSPLMRRVPRKRALPMWPGNSSAPRQ